MLRAGPPWFTRLGLPGPRKWFNVHEFFVYHEDVRRSAGRGPRSLGADLDEALWRRLRALAPGDTGLRNLPLARLRHEPAWLELSALPADLLSAQ